MAQKWSNEENDKDCTEYCDYAKFADGSACRKYVVWGPYNTFVEYVKAVDKYDEEEFDYVLFASHVQLCSSAGLRSAAEMVEKAQVSPGTEVWEKLRTCVFEALMWGEYPEVGLEEMMTINTVRAQVGVATAEEKFLLNGWI